MTRAIIGRSLALIITALAAVACGQPAPTPEATPRVTAMPAPTDTPTSTPTPTFTPTSTPTPTAVPMAIGDDLRASRLATPMSKRGAPCGVVDILDFPVGPPDGNNYRAPWPFGYLSDRYNGIHAGEDWISLSGSSLGKPVYAIGHGTVTYAQPLGWGIDQGVVIIRHVFNDGHTILSFYGHLDPSSVVLKAGDCVKRGDQVGAIGNPRGRPHLHFEIRQHMPDQPGPGYWPVDPTLAGWKSPTAYIWADRMRTSPGVKWTRTFTSTDSIGLGVIDNSLIAFDDQKLIALNADDGTLQWSQTITGTLHRTLVDATGSSIYISTITGTLEAFDASGTLRWQMNFGETTRPVLMPLPGGGVIVHVDQQLIGLSASADRLWQIDQIAAPFDWLLQDDRLIFSTSGDQAATYSLDRSSQLIKLADIGGRLTISRDQFFIYNPTGIYRINAVTHSVDLLLPLDSGSFDTGRLVAAYDGTLIVAHRGLFDRRLIALKPDGTLRWERSVSELGRTVPRLVTLGQRVYAITFDGDVLLIDTDTGHAQRIFDGASALLPGEAWAMATRTGRMIFDFRGGTLVAIDPRVAINIDEAVHDQ